MPVFAYRALTNAGRARAGVLAAESARAAWQELRGRGVYPTDVHEHTPATRWIAGRVTAAELAAATRELATLVEAGLPLADALAAVAEQAEHPTLVRALTVAHARLREGASLADALAATPRVFPPLFRELVRAGEASGALPAVLVRLADHTEASAVLRARLRTALTYPTAMAIATVAVLAFLLAWVVPQLTSLFADAGARLPLPTRALLAVTGVLHHIWWAALPAAVAATVLATRWAATFTGRARLDAAILRAPLAGRLVLRAAAARFARTMSTLLTGGVPMEAALDIAGATIGNRTLAAGVAAARDAVRRGEPLAPALRTAGFPPLLIRLTAAGERSATLPQMLDRAATTHDREVETTIAALTSLLEPALVLAMGAVVLALVCAILLPLMELDGVLR